MVAQALILTHSRQSQVDLWIQGQPGLQSEFQDGRESYTEKLSHKTKKERKKKQLREQGPAF